MSEQTRAGSLPSALHPLFLEENLAQLLPKPSSKGKSQRGSQGQGCKGRATILTPERVQAAVPGEGGCSRTAEMGQGPGAPQHPRPPHPEGIPSPRPHLPGPPTREEVEKTAWGRGEGGLNLFWRTLAETIWADDMEAMLWRALSLETWSWGGERPREDGQVRHGAGARLASRPLPGPQGSVVWARESLSPFLGLSPKSTSPL